MSDVELDSECSGRDRGECGRRASDDTGKGSCHLAGHFMDAKLMR